MAELSYDAFISYRRSDGTAAARRIRQMLQGYRLPLSLRQGHPRRLTVFLDTAYERGAADFYRNTIQPALLAARWLVVIATPDAVKRPAGEDWIAREVADFSSGPNAGNVIVVRAAGEFMGELPADIAQRYPNVQIVDLRDPGRLARISPQRAARLAGETLKLVGPVFGVALEDMPRLRREEERRQVGRLGMLAGATAATAILVAGLSLFALKSQWDGQEALKQSFNAARQSVVQLAGSYAAEEPLDSPIREVVLRNCDLANRMQLLSGAAPDLDQQLACTIEEQRALILAGRAEGAINTIAAELAAGEERASRQSGDPTDAMTVVTSGLRTWIALDPDSTAARERFAAFMRATGIAALKAGSAADAISPDFDLREAVRLLEEASATGYALGEMREAAGQAAEAADDYHAAFEDALLVDQALQLVHRVAPDDPKVSNYWSTLADLVQQAALGEAIAAVVSDRQRAAAALERALDFFSRSDAEDFADGYRRAARRAAIAGTQVVIAGDSQVDEALPPALWICLEDGFKSISDPAAGPDDSERQVASGALNNCLHHAARMTDARRDEINRMWQAGDLEAAASLLRVLLADAERIDATREFRQPWDELYRAIAYRDLAAIEAAANRPNQAAAARQRALALFAPYLDFDRVEDSAEHVALARAAWADVVAAEKAARQ